MELSKDAATQTGDLTAFGKSLASKREACKFYADHPQQMTLDSLLESGLDIYVRNNVDRGGRIAVDFLINNRKQVITIPNTWIPIKLNDYAPHRDISSSGSLRDFLRKAALVLVHPDVAESELSTPRGQRELQNFRSDLAKAQDAKKAVLTPRPSNEVSDRMKSFVIEYQDAKTDEDKTTILDKIFSNTRTFNIADIAYLQDKCQGDSVALEQAAEMLVAVESRLSA